MGGFIVYTLKGAVILGVMFSIYMLTMSRLKCIRLRRLSLVLIYVMSLFLPLFGFLNVARDNPSPVADVLPSSISAPQSVVGGETESMVYDIVGLLLIAGMSLSVFHYAYSVFSLMRQTRKGRKEKVGGLEVMVVGGNLSSPFCFGRRIYVSEEDYGNVGLMALVHEDSHVRHRHFIDLIIARTLGALQWWNPLAWLMMRELHEVHEFQADGDVIEAGYDRKSYQYLLLERVAGKNIISLGNGLRHSRLKHRLLMMDRSVAPGWKRLSAVWLVASGVAGWVLISMPALGSVFNPFGNIGIPFQRDAVMSLKNDKDKDAVVVNLDSIPREKTPSVTVDGRLVDYDDAWKNIDPQRIKSITVLKEPSGYPEGRIEIELLSEEEYEAKRKEIESGNNKTLRESSLSDVKVVGTGTVRK